MSDHTQDHQHPAEVINLTSCITMSPRSSSSPVSHNSSASRMLCLFPSKIISSALRRVISRLLILRSTQLFLLLLFLISYPNLCCSASTRRLNSRFRDLSLMDNYTRVYQALDQGMRDPKRLEAAFRTVDMGRALNVFDVARAIVPGELWLVIGTCAR